MDIAKATEELSVISTLRELVMTQNACALDGVKIRYDTFLPCMWRAVSRGFVAPEAAQFVHDGLRWGFKAGIQVQHLRGR